MGIHKPPISKEVLEDMMRRKQIERDARELKFQAEMARVEQMTEIKRREIQRMMDLQSPSTSSVYDPRTYNSIYDTKTPFGHKPEQWVDGRVIYVPIEKTPEPEQQTPHVVPTGGKKHKIEVEEISHKIVPRRKSIIETVVDYLKIKTRSTGPK